MCYSVKTKFRMKEAEKVFDAHYDGSAVEAEETITGFDNPSLAIISDENLNLITAAEWGLNPSIRESVKNATVGLNARAETLENVNLFKTDVDKHCVLLVSAYYEWQHVTVGRKTQKVKHEITMANLPVFALAGIYSVYGGQKYFTVVTTEANKLMEQIHNTKKRMPIALSPAAAEEYLAGQSIHEFELSNYNPKLRAENLEPEKVPPGLF